MTLLKVETRKLQVKMTDDGEGQLLIHSDLYNVGYA